MSTLENNQTSAVSNIDNQDFVFKLVIVGDSGVGKSCLMHHFIYNRFKKDTTQTIGVDFSAKSIKLGSQEIKLQIWDTAGQEKFRSVARSYYRGAIGIVIVYDITKAESFQHVPQWLNDAKNSARNECSVCVVGNKSDLEDSRLISLNEGSKYCLENNLMHFECSAFTGQNVDEIFLSLSKHILNKIDNGIIDVNSVVSSYSREMKKISMEESKTKNGNGNCYWENAC